MDKPPDPAAFRAAATTAYRFACAGLVAFVIVAGWVGWHFGGWVGLAVGLVIGAFLAVIGWIATTLLWAMTQDGG